MAPRCARVTALTSPRTAQLATAPRSICFWSARERASRPAKTTCCSNGCDASHSAVHRSVASASAPTCWRTRDFWTAGVARCTGKVLAAFAEQFPRIRTTTDIFVIDGNRWTCSGGTAGLDMMLQVIAARESLALANDVSEQFIHPRIRATHDPQRMAIQTRLGVANKKLLAAIGLMEEGNDEPRHVAQIAAAVELSPRQLERLFGKYLRATPGRYYLELRLDRARMLLLQTTKPILDIAVACGFASASHFSRCYRARYGHKPSEERSAAVVERMPNLGRARPKDRRELQRHIAGSRRGVQE